MIKKIRASLLLITFIIMAWGIASRSYHLISSSALTFATIFAVDFLFHKSRVPIPPVMTGISYAFIFLSMTLGKSLCFYGIPYWDKFLHISSGVILGFIGILTVWSLNSKSGFELAPKVIVGFVIAFSIACAGAWEIWEFTTDNLFGLNAQNGSLWDTMWDIICGTIGGGFVALMLYIYFKGKGCRFFKNMFQYMDGSR